MNSIAAVKKFIEYVCDDKMGWSGYWHWLKCVRSIVKEGVLLEELGISEERLEELRIKCTKTSIGSWLKQLQNGTNAPDILFLAIHRTIEEEKMFLSDFDVSKGVLSGLVKSNHKKYALEHVKKLRERCPEYVSLIGRIYRGLEMEYFTLLEIGTNEEELAELEIRNRNVLISNLLFKLRDGSMTENAFADGLSDLVSLMNQTDLPPEEFGTSLKELKKFDKSFVKEKDVKPSQKKDIIECIKNLRKGDFNYDFLLICVYQSLDLFSLSEIGTSEEELAGLEIRNRNALIDHLLFNLRKGCGNIEITEEHIGDLFSLMSQTSLSQSELGISDKEMEEFSELFVDRKHLSVLVHDDILTYDYLCRDFIQRYGHVKIGNGKDTCAQGFADQVLYLENEKPERDKIFEKTEE